MIGEVVELGGNRKEFGPRFHSHFPRHFTLIIFRPVDSQGEGANGLRMVAGGEVKNGAVIHSPAEVAPDRDIRASSNTDGFLQRMTELPRVFGIGPRWRGSDRLRIC